MIELKTLAELSQEVCQVDNIFKRIRKRPYVVARQIVMVIMRDDFGYSLIEIAKFFSMDHTTVIAGVRKSHDLIDTKDHYFTQRYRAVQNDERLLMLKTDISRMATNIY